MARRTLDRHPKFKRLWRELKISRAQARGHLEFWWDSAHDASNPEFKSADEVEACAEWDGDQGVLTAKLLELKLADPGPNGTIIVHNYWKHCPDYVHKRLKYRLQHSAENGGKQRKKAAERRTDPRPEPVPKPQASKSPVRIDARVPAPVDRHLNERPIKSKRGGEVANAGSVAQAIINSIPAAAATTAPGPRSKRQPRDCYSFDLTDCVHFIASFERSGTPQKNQANWRSRLAPIAKTKSGMHWLRELCDHVQQSILGDEIKGISKLNNIAAYCNKETAEYLADRKTG